MNTVRPSSAVTALRSRSPCLSIVTLQQGRGPMPTTEELNGLAKAVALTEPTARRLPSLFKHFAPRVKAYLIRAGTCGQALPKNSLQEAMVSVWAQGGDVRSRAGQRLHLDLAPSRATCASTTCGARIPGGVLASRTWTAKPNCGRTACAVARRAGDRPTARSGRAQCVAPVARRAGPGAATFLLRRPAPCTNRARAWHSARHRQIARAPRRESLAPLARRTRIMILHHPDDDLLLAFAAGNLLNGHSLLVATHVEGCAHCRERMRLLEAVGGAMLEGRQRRKCCRRRRWRERSPRSMHQQRPGHARMSNPPPCRSHPRE